MADQEQLDEVTIEVLLNAADIRYLRRLTYGNLLICGALTLAMFIHG